jgi:predicted nucleic acid-binding Zn ribbon protein
MYGLVVIFFATAVLWTVFVDVVLLGQIINDVVAFLVAGVVAPAVWFYAFLYAVRATFFNYHELTDKELIVSVPPFSRFRVPLEEIIEMESDASKIRMDFGTVRLEVKSEKDLLQKEHYWGKFKTFGTRVQPFGNETMVQSVFSDKNLVRIKAKDKDIITNVPDVKEFVEEVSKAMQQRKSGLKLQNEGTPNNVTQLPMKSCTKCGKKLPEDARPCESCGALVEQDKPKHEDLRERSYALLWKAIFYPC